MVSDTHRPRNWFPCVCLSRIHARLWLSVRVARPPRVPFDQSKKLRRHPALDRAGEVWEGEEPGQGRARVRHSRQAQGRRIAVRYQGASRL